MNEVTLQKTFVVLKEFRGLAVGQLTQFTETESLQLIADSFIKPEETETKKGK